MVLDEADIKQLLLEAVVEWRGKLIYFFGYSRSSNVFSYIDLETGDENSAVFKFEDFDNPNVRLGYVNCLGKAVHFERIPARQFKMGVNSGNTVTRSVKGCNRAEDRLAISFFSRPFVNMLKGRYPTLKEAFNKAKFYENVVAFDRQFAVSYEGLIIHTGTDAVATYSYMDNRVKFEKKLAYLAKTMRNYEDVEIG